MRLLAGRERPEYPCQRLPRDHQAGIYPSRSFPVRRAACIAAWQIRLDSAVLQDLQRSAVLARRCPLLREKVADLLENALLMRRIVCRQNCPELFEEPPLIAIKLFRDLDVHMDP